MVGQLMSHAACGLVMARWLGHYNAAILGLDESLASLYSPSVLGHHWFVLGHDFVHDGFRLCSDGTMTLASLARPLLLHVLSVQVS